MNRPFKIKPAAWFLAGWFVVFAALSPQSVALCFGEPDHVEAEVRGVVCCCMDPERTSSSTGILADLPTDPCVDCYHVEVSFLCRYSNRLTGKGFDRHMSVRGRSDCTFVPSSESADKPSAWSRLAVGDLIPPLLLEHLSTLILIC